jgi:molybdopterin/thiamine biosynthesis adenylyltransferase
MSSPPDYFARIIGSVNFSLLQRTQTVIVGVGQVGSHVAEELANCGVGTLLLIDHDSLERSNLSRHVLGEAYLGQNKAIALAAYLDDEVENVQTYALPRSIDPTVSDDLLDEWLRGAELVVIATDDPDAQKRVAHRALMLNINAVIPALYEEDGGEVVVQMSLAVPCFNCLTAFRDTAERVHGASRTNFSTLPVIFTAVGLCLALLDPDSQYTELMTTGPGKLVNQLFQLDRFGQLERLPIQRRPDCPACGSPRSEAEALAESTKASAGRRSMPLAVAAGLAVLIAVIILSVTIIHNAQHAERIDTFLHLLPAAVHPCVNDTREAERLSVNFVIACKSDEINYFVTDSLSQLAVTIKDFDPESECPWLGYGWFDVAGGIVFGSVWCSSTGSAHGTPVLWWCDALNMIIGDVQGKTPAETIQRWEEALQPWAPPGEQIIGVSKHEDRILPGTIYHRAPNKVAQEGCEST